MPTYYKYAEHQADSQINWAEIGKGITDMLSNERKVREAKREALDEVSRNLGNTLADRPQGEDPNANGVITNFSDAAQQQRLLDDRLFKSGQMDYKTYIARRQNLVDDTKLTFSLAETYQKSYKEKMERYEQKKSQGLEIEAAKELEGLSDFTNSQLYIDPVDCTVKAAKTKKEMVNGKEVTVPDKNNIFGVKSLFKNMTIKYDRFDTNDAVKKAADSFGEVENVIVTAAGIHSNGKITTLLDPTQRRKWENNADAKKAMSLYEQAESNKIKQIMANPYNVSSILTEDMGGYHYTNDPEEVKKDPTAILKKIDPSTGRMIAVPTDEQKQDVVWFLQKQIRSSLDSKEKVQVTGQLARNEPTYRPPAKTDEKKEENKNALSLWMDIYSQPTVQGKSTAIQAFLGTPGAIKAGIVDIDPSDGQNLKIKYKDPSLNRTINFKNVDALGWASIGSEFHNVIDKPTLQQFSKGKQFADIGTDWNQVKAGRLGEATKEELASYISTKTNATPFTKKESLAVSDLNKMYSGLGFKFDTSGIFNNVTVTAPDGVTTIELPTNESAEDAQTQLDLLNEFIVNNTSSKTRMALKAQGLFGGSTQTPTSTQTPSGSTPNGLPIFKKKK